jgi:uncharacterized protein YnzC (UPF0291/DUF896 family)
MSATVAKQAQLTIEQARRHKERTALAANYIDGIKEDILHQLGHSEVGTDDWDVHEIKLYIAEIFAEEIQARVIRDRFAGPHYQNDLLRPFSKRMKKYKIARQQGRF